MTRCGAAVAHGCTASPGTTTALAPAATGPPGATAGSWSASSCSYRSCAGRCACRSWPGCGSPASQTVPAHPGRELVDLVVAHVGDRRVHLVGDAASIGKPLRGLPSSVTVTARLRSDAALYQPAPPRNGRPGRLHRKGNRLPELVVMAAMTRYRWTPVKLRCYGKALDREVLALRCLWYGALGSQLVRVVLSRPVGAPDGYQLALVTTDLAATPKRSSNATPTAGPKRPHSWTPATWPASARPAPAPSARWSAWSPSAWRA
jgi:hypothetical protein